jgi:hypothetical protein
MSAQLALQSSPVSLAKLRDLIFALIDENPEMTAEDLAAEFRFRHKDLYEAKWDKQVDENTLWLQRQIEKALDKRAALVSVKAPARQESIAEQNSTAVVSEPETVEQKANHFLRIAEGCIERGEFRILPIKIGGKNPLIKWKDAPFDVANTAEWLKLAAAHIQDIGQRFPDANACVVAKPDESLFLDIDTMKEFREAYERFSGELYPRTYTTSARENRCQEHWLQTDATRAMGNIGQFQVDGIDFSVRQHNLYVLAEGSQHPQGGTYRKIVDAAITPTPDNLVAFIKHLCEKAGQKHKTFASSQNQNPSVFPKKGPTTDEELNRIAKDFIKRTVPEGTIQSGTGHDTFLNKLSGKLREEGGEQEQIEEILTRACEEVCPDHGSDWLEMVEKHARNICKKPVGDDTRALVGGKPASTDIVKSSEQIREERKAAEVQSVLDNMPKISELSVAVVEDMPEDCLIGRLGEAALNRMKSFPLAYSWLTLGIHAAQFVPASPFVISQPGQGILSGDSSLYSWRQNLYFTPVGLVHSGKSMAGEFARGLLGMGEDDLPVINVMPGSAEGLMKKIGDANGQTRLVNVDEFGFLLNRAALEGASLPYILDRSYYKTAYSLTTTGGKEILFNCRLSVLGGVTLKGEGAYESFGDLFGEQTVGGMFDRMLIGLQPTGWEYEYLPFSGPALNFDLLKLKPVMIGNDVWEAKNAWVKQHKLNPRVTESCVRVAGICAAYDGVSILRPKDIETSVVALAKYQTRLRLILQPNTGKNDDGKLASKFLSYLQRHTSAGEWVSERRMLRDTHAYDYGTRAEKVLASLLFNGEIQRGRSDVSSGPAAKVVRLVIV